MKLRAAVMLCYTSPSCNAWLKPKDTHNLLRDGAQQAARVSVKSSPKMNAMCYDPDQSGSQKKAPNCWTPNDMGSPCRAVPTIRGSCRYAKGNRLEVPGVSKRCIPKGPST